MARVLISARMRLSLCQLDPTVGDLEGNRALILRDARRAAEAGASLAIYPELALTGYPPRDLLERPAFIADTAAALDALASELPKGITALVGFVERAAREVGPSLHNSLAVVRGGEIVAIARKRLLPTYDVFDEARYFAPGDESTVIEVDGVRVGLTICEDMWNTVPTPLATRRYDVDPVAEVIAKGAELVVNVSASPFILAKRIGRGEMLATVARRHARPLVFVNQVGGNDDLVFDGASASYAADGKLLHRLPSFDAASRVIELGSSGTLSEGPLTDEAAALDALTLGVRDYAAKCGFSGALVGLSGGIDSALTAAIAARALGPENVLGLAMPTRFSSRHSLDDARALAENLGIDYRVVPIDAIFQAYIDALTEPLDSLGPAGPGDVTFENIQARIRGATLMAMSNRRGLLLLTTGNKSEIAVGYCTLYGDMAGGLAVIADLSKTFVYRVSREVNRQAGRELVPRSTLEKPPSAELRPDQKDSDSLPDYSVLDAILERHVERGLAADDIVAEGFERAVVERVVRMVRAAEYKRRQMPPGLILTAKAFAVGRRFPIAQRYTR